MRTAQGGKIYGSLTIGQAREVSSRSNQYELVLDSVGGQDPSRALLYSPAASSVDRDYLCRCNRWVLLHETSKHVSRIRIYKWNNNKASSLIKHKLIC